MNANKNSKKISIIILIVLFTLICMIFSVFNSVSLSRTSSSLTDNNGNDPWIAYLHDSANSGYSSTKLGSELKMIKNNNDFGDDTLGGGFIYNNKIVVNYTNWIENKSGVIELDATSLQETWRVDLQHRYCLTPPVLNPDNKTLFVASNEGFSVRGSSSSIISCLNLDDGEFEWEGKVEGSVYGPMVYNNNQLFYQNYFCKDSNNGTESDPGDLGCINAQTGSIKWTKRMDYSFLQGDTGYICPTILGQQIIIPNTFITHKENNEFAAGETSIFYSFNLSSGNKNWEINKDNCLLPEISIDQDVMYLTFTEKKGDSYTQKLEAYSTDRTLKWSYNISSSIGWCSTPIFNDKFIFLRSRDGRVYCIDKETGKRKWNTSSSYDFRAGDGSIYAVNDDFLITSFFSADTSNVIMMDLSKNSSKPIWKETIEDNVKQIILYNTKIFFIGRKSIYVYQADTPLLKVKPESISASMEENNTKTTYLEISNSGSGNLSGTISSSNSWLNVSPSTFSNQTTITVTIDTTDLSKRTYSGSIEIKSNGGNKTIPVSLEVSKKDTSPPVIEISTPDDNIETTEIQIQIKGKVYDEESGIKSLTINGNDITIDETDGSFEYYFDLSEGKNTIEIIATNTIGLETTKTFTIMRKAPDTTGPTITIDYPKPNQSVYESPLIVKGKVMDEESGVEKISVNGNYISFESNGYFETILSLQLGKNTIRVEATDKKGNMSNTSFEVVYEEKKLIIIELWIGNRIALVDGKPVALEGVPMIVSGRTVVPLRFIAEAFKADVFFDSENQEINIAFGATYISLWINKTKARIETTENGEKKNRIVILDAPPIIRSGRTLVPVRFIAEAFGATIDWDSGEEKITIKCSLASNSNLPPPPDSPSGVGNERGNSVGNIGNFGIATIQDDWIYYVNDNDSNKIYKIRSDGTGRQKLNEDDSLYLNVIGSWLYYSNEKDGNKIYKIRTDGTGRQKVNNDCSSELNVIGDWIYYVCKIDDNNKIYKIHTDGTGRMKVCSDFSSALNVVGDWIYYTYKDDDDKIYKIRTDGTERQKVNDDNSWFLNVVGDWIYYYNGTFDGNILYKIRTDGTGRQKVI